MSNWGEDKLKVKDTIADILPKQWIIEHRYILEKVYLTTFSLDMAQLNQLLYEMDILKNLENGKIHVFYDKTARGKQNSGEQILSSEFLHGISIPGYAFHPKVILLKYSNKEDRGYVVVVLSKNISNTDFLDAYAAACGTVGEQEAKNGTHIAGFMETVLEKGCLDEKDLIEDLKKTNFRQVDCGKKVFFYDAKEVFGELKKAKKLLVVSPFLSEGFLAKIGQDRVDCIVSSGIGFSKLKKENAEKLIDSGKCRWFGKDENASALHAKVYCYKKEDKTYWMIGSSNATVNGCDVFGRSGNMEYNMGFQGDNEEYDAFSALLNGKAFKAFCLDDYDVFSNMKDEKSDFRKCYAQFLDEVDITTVYEKSDNKPYTVRLERKQEADRCINCNVKIALNDADDYKLFDETVLVLASRNPIGGVNVKIQSGDSGDEQIFYLDLYDRLEPYAKAEFDKQCRNNYIDMLKYMQNQILDGKGKVPVYSHSSLNGGNSYSMSPKSEDKTYVFERILKVCQGADSFEKQELVLHGLKQITDQITKQYPDDKFQNDLHDILEEMLKIMGEINE